MEPWEQTADCCWEHRGSLPLFMFLHLDSKMFLCLWLPECLQITSFGKGRAGWEPRPFLRGQGLLWWPEWMMLKFSASLGLAFFILGEGADERALDCVPDVLD